MSCQPSITVHIDLVPFHAPASSAQKSFVGSPYHLPGAKVHLLAEDDAPEGLSEFCGQQQARLLVLATSDGYWVRRFFNPLYRRTHAYYLRVLALRLSTSTLPTQSYCAHCLLRQVAEASSRTSPVLRGTR